MQASEVAALAVRRIARGSRADPRYERFGSGSDGKTRVKIRKTSANAPRKPSAMPIWTGPEPGAVSFGTSDGQTSTLRSSQKPNSDDERDRRRGSAGVFFGRWPSSTQNGVTQQPTQANSVTE